MKLRILTLALSLSMPAMASDDFDLTDMVPARPGAEQVDSDDVLVQGDAIVADDASLAVAVAHQALIENDEDGVKMIQVGSGTGILSIGSVSYTTYDNLNATLLSKRGAYNQAYLIAKKQLIENMTGVDHQCSNLVQTSMDAIDTGVDSVANTQTKMMEACKESISGSLAGFVTFDVYDDVAASNVRVSLISTPKTRAQVRQKHGAVAVTTDPNSIFKQVVSDIKGGVLPPVGAKILTHAETGEVVVMGYGSAIIRQNKNKSVANKLRSAAKSQSQTRARSALLATMQGEKVYWEGSFDEKQMEGSSQFQYDDPYMQDPQQVKVLENDRETFVNQFKQSDDYSTLAKGTLPAGVSVKSFSSEDGYWQYSIAVYSPSLEATAKKANKEMQVGGQSLNASDNSARKIKAVGGVNNNAANPQAASGKVSSTEEL
ncbi:hypothetical protein ACFL6Z_02455 [Pseudomonadota bacterium]|uniref:hypothetical protein n=1 Tax=unclassified Shewanella TaxID=196818 RepID=UPI000C864CF4|nr:MULTISPECIES: hypothetical protein [unclassified Shewanella]MDO6639009.1 hypothetical protein [Shewanella sp. 5_MG-2023]MDO6677030.1 hypothetical protein [Shewanella sp. 4_MG-2023]PMG27559.1 hypothetical protein BCU94_04130 [Shewanella sp. 10N.286.52.C2]PMH86682.1 hypothetical protein BCU57_11160 [Shewanella sp. 10N.286.48.B5]PMH95131.1 hypothetical protein BCU55_02820 [Shewanella sp. 10N.286.48.A6]